MPGNENAPAEISPDSGLGSTHLSWIVNRVGRVGERRAAR